MPADSTAEIEMSRQPGFFKAIALTIAATMFLTSMPLGLARAGLVSTERLVEARAAASERERLAAILLRGDVGRQMVALGVDRDEAMARLASLSDREVREIAGKLDQLPAGQSVIAGVLIIAGAVLLGLVLLDLLGVTDVFTFINPIT